MSDNDMWKQKYLDYLDKTEANEAAWTKSQQLLKQAVNRISIIAEGENPLIDHHLHALRTVLKSQYTANKLESVISELFDVVSQVDASSVKATKQGDLICQILESVQFPKQTSKELKAITKNLRGKKKINQEELTSVTRLLTTVVESNDSAGQTTERPSLIAKLFSRKSAESNEVLSSLSSAIGLLPWPEQLKSEVNSLVTNLEKPEQKLTEFQRAIGQFSKLAKQWPKNTAENKSPAEKTSGQIDVQSFDILQTMLQKLKLDTVSAGKLDELQKEIRLSPEKMQQHVDKLVTLINTSQATYTENKTAIKSNSLSTFISSLKRYAGVEYKLDDLDLSKESAEDDVARHLAGLLNQNLHPHEVLETVVKTQTSFQPPMRELLIQLLEQLIVPVELMKELDELKEYLETEISDEKWNEVLKKVAHLINDVRSFQQSEKDEFEHFLHEITNRLQDMVSYIQTENKQISKNESDSQSFGNAMEEEMLGLRDSVAEANDLAELESVVNIRLDAIANHLKMQSENDSIRFSNSRENLDSMQQKIDELEKETANLRLAIDEKNKQALYDVLTGIPNRLFFEQRVKEDIGRWERFDTPLSLVIWDVDKFKRINDTYGHKAGDKVLHTIAQILDKRIRNTDFLARYGGEEFVMLLPGTIEEETLRLANELRVAVTETPFHYQGEKVDITISCGISSFRQGDDLNTVFERADAALYQAKDSGRNRCVVAAMKSD